MCTLRLSDQSPSITDVCQMPTHCVLGCPGPRNRGKAEPGEAAPAPRDVAAPLVPLLAYQYKGLPSGAPEAVATVFLPGRHSPTSTREAATQWSAKYICSARVVGSCEVSHTSPRFRWSVCLFPVRDPDFADLASTPRYSAHPSGTRQSQSSRRGSHRSTARRSKPRIEANP